MFLWRSDGNPLSWILFLTVKHSCYFFPEFMWWFVHQGAGHSQQRIRVDAWMCRDLPNDLHIHFYIKTYTPPKTNSKFFPLKNMVGVRRSKPFIFWVLYMAYFQGTKITRVLPSELAEVIGTNPWWIEVWGGETEKGRFSSLNPHYFSMGLNRSQMFFF